ncbi:TRAF3-interacting protein 1-like [Megalops cyprinoides]|uniref:TRAF3-interacting protein 1-like n=1 Tax=Megalops cyprinoides TaxID=118141 RepID=UPI001864C092|nr:TRAF3-interacting protein 1-like [Megalops cyprinoides]
MNEAVAKKTQDTLGKVIKKPPLTEKLLSKPPFRYLHDIFSEVIRTTGFMKGLYTEAELKSDNVKDKDAKIAFLQKAIDVVTVVSGESLAVKPARIVAGHEPERTNELLQAIGKCCLSKLSSEDAVRRVLAGERPDLRGKSQDKENREGREPPRGKEERREIRDRSSSRDRKDSEQQREESRRTEKDRHREGERSDKGRERTKDREREKDKSRDRDKAKERESQKDVEKRRDREREKDRDREREKDRDRERDRDRQRHKDAEEKNREEEKADRKSRGPEEPSKPRKHEPEDLADETQAESPSRIPRPSSAKGQRRRPKAGQDESDSEGEADSPSAEKPPVPLENGDVKDSVPPHPTQSSRRISRPSSARPAPPRVRKQESHSEVPSADRLGSAKPSSAVIVEGKQLSDDEDGDAQFVVEDAAAPPAERPVEVDGAVELQGEEKHGGLVKKILETKRDYETSPSSPKSKAKGAPVSETAHRKERDLVSREMERLRSSIQTVCRSALPLGKIMDYIQEDMDSMQNELQAWRRENQEHAHALLQEQRVTDSAVEPLKTELTELEQLIKDQQDKICAIKCNILRNEEKIQKMLSSINFSSRT